MTSSPLIERRYPLWLNITATLALLTVGSGLVAFCFDQMTGVGMEAVGWLGIWVTGTLAERTRAKATSND